MMYGLVIVVHILVAIFLIAVILLQGGRGGLGEALGGAAAQSLFGGGANTVMTKITAVGAALFMVTCLSLAMLSTARGRSVVDQIPMSLDELPATLPQPPADQAPVTPVAGPEESAPVSAPASSAAPAEPAPSTSTPNP
jgi:preprotein translocase subunit SecG